MELGEKIKQARLEAGLSQRQLCGEEITRNMLSRIENGAAKPSMKTLQYLAGRLGKNTSYFLDETAVLSPNQSLMTSVRQQFDSGNFQEAGLMLEQYRAPDPVYDREQGLLRELIRLELAKDAIRQDRLLYAAELLKQPPVRTAYFPEALDRQRLLLLGSIPGHSVSSRLPSIDDELLIRAREAAEAGDLTRAVHLLESMEQADTPGWHLLRGKIYLRQKKWKTAASHLRMAEAESPREVIPLLEICYRESGNFQKAYEYACKQRK